MFLKTISGTYFFVLLQVVKQLNCTLSEEEKEHSSKNDRAISKCLKEADLQKLLRVKVRPMTKLHQYLIFLFPQLFHILGHGHLYYYGPGSLQKCLIFLIS